jgi:hypothetical protein
MFKLVEEREVVLHTLKCFLKKGGQFAPKSCDIIECVEKKNDEWGHCFFALELLLPKIKSPCAAKFMCHAGNDDFWFYVRREYHCQVYARIKSAGLIFALPDFSPIVVFYWKAFVLHPTNAYAKKTVMLLLISFLEPRGFAPPDSSTTCKIASGSTS